MPRPKPRIYTQRQAAELLGIDEDTLFILRDRGALAVGPYRGQGRPRLVRWDALVDCAKDPLYALALHVTGRKCAEPLLREYARIAAAGRRWWGGGDLAAACGITDNTVRWRRARGWGGAEWKYWGPLLYWWGAEPPPWPLRELSGLGYGERYAVLGSWAAVAAEVGKSEDSVKAAYYYAKRQG